MHNRRGREKVVKSHVYFGAFRNANEGTGHLKRFAFLTECVDLHARTGIGFRVPVSLPRFEVKRQDSVLQLSGRCAIGVGLSFMTGLRQTRTVATIQPAR
jgi:hypothetical protein